MIRLSIRRKIMGIAVTLIVLMAVTAILSMVSVMQVSARLEELTTSYIPAYGNLARAKLRRAGAGIAPHGDRTDSLAIRQRPPDRDPQRL